MTAKTQAEEKSFEGQRDNEEVIAIFRRHIIAMRRGFYMLLVPLVVTAVPPLIWQSQLELFLLPLAGLAVGIILFLYNYIIWRYTVFVLTNQRLRQITQRGFFGSDVVELKLSKIHNISYNVPGFSGEIFGFGTIVIQTYVGDLVINNVSHPDKTYNLLQDAVDAAESNKGNELYEEAQGEINS